MSETESALSPEMEALKTRLKATWIAGDFGQIANAYQESAAEFIERLRLQAGEKLLDVACGTGSTALPAARAGAIVTGVDIAPNLLEQARARAAEEGLHCRFDEGDAEALAYRDGSFDTVVTMFGAMFAPRPARVAAELVRVCRAGGRIVMANWTPGGFIGQMFKRIGAHVPPPSAMPSPILWGDEETARERLQNGVAEVRFSRRAIRFDFPFPPAAVVEHFRKFYGPTQKAFDALAADRDKQTALRSDLENLWTENNQASDETTVVESEYLEVTATRA